MRSVWLALAVMGCGFHHGHGPSDGASDSDNAADGSSDAPMPDAFVAPQFCTPDSHLRLCFSFDQNPLPSPLPDEGAAALSATLTNVTHVAGSGGGGAAQVGATSEILLPATSEVMNIHAVELWLRITTDPPAGSRYGIIDAAGSPNLDMFYYANAAPPLRQIRCGLGSPDDLFTPELPAAPTGWEYVVCVCESDGTTKMYVDGSLVVMKAEACTGGAITQNGLTIGQNNNGTGVAVDSQLVGAFDGIRMWDQPLAAATICATSGHATCP